MQNKYFIKIDRKSIKVNPNAGAMMSRVLGHREVTFECIGEFPKELVDGKNVHLISWEEFNGKRIKTNGYVFDDETEKFIWEKLRTKEWVRFNMKMEQNYQTIHHPPIAKYSYKFKDKQLKCNFCKSKIMYSQLKSDSGEFGEHSFEVCPICGAWDCCELKFEHINDVNNKPQ